MVVTVDGCGNTDGDVGVREAHPNLRAIPVSLKNKPDALSVKAIFRELKENAKQIEKHEALPSSDPMSLPKGTGSNTVAHVQSPQFTSKEVIDFVNNSNPNKFQPNVFKEILIDTKDGIVIVDSSRKANMKVTK